MNDDIYDRVRKRASGGFTLAEVLIVIMIIAILAGCMMFAISRVSDNAEAAVIMSDLDAAKNALFAYSMEHRTRTSDRLEDFIDVGSSAILGSLDNYMSSQVTTDSKAKARFDQISVTSNDVSGRTRIRIGFSNIEADQGLINALKRKIDAQSGAANYLVDESTPSIWLDVK
jgi:prepilin-type N-terminal cleavage/methylation domain-containing protein